METVGDMLIADNDVEKMSIHGRKKNKTNAEQNLSTETENAPLAIAGDASKRDWYEREDLNMSLTILALRTHAYQTWKAQGKIRHNSDSTKNGISVKI